jgi:flavin reductase (DIM6/NTAB) family NADH-FMN oxidoreductase RutF
MPDFPSSAREPLDLYKLIIGCVVPRPIAWVSTRDRDGHNNVAPFSFFNGVGYNPPTLAFSVIDRPDGMKDTARNIGEHPEFVIHIVSEEMTEKMNVTCGEYGAHIDEFQEADLTPVAGTAVKVPRIREALVAMECRMTHHLRIGAKPPYTSHFLGEVLYWHLAEAIMMERGRIDAGVLRAIGRMGGSEYTRTRDRFVMERPVVPAADPRSVASTPPARRER